MSLSAVVRVWFVPVEHIIINTGTVYEDLEVTHLWVRH